MRKRPRWREAPYDMAGIVEAFEEAPPGVRLVIGKGQCKGEWWFNHRRVPQWTLNILIEDGVVTKYGNTYRADPPNQ